MTIKITIQCKTSEDAEKLFWAVHSGELEHLGVIDCQFLEPTKEGEQSTDPTLPTPADGVED